MTKPTEKHCEICGETDCKDPLNHIEDEGFQSLCLGTSFEDPFCYCPDCGEGQTVHEQYGVYDCKCGGKVRHHMAVIESA